jgi:hypothetical protein
VAAVIVAAVVGVALALAAVRVFLPDGSPSSTAKPTPATASTAASSPADPAAGRVEAVQGLLAQRAKAVGAGDRTLFLATVDPAAPTFYRAQTRLFDRVATLEFAQWSYQVTGDGPGFAADRARELPRGSAIIRVRLTYRLTGTQTTTDREQYLTVVPVGTRWLLASDTDAASSGLDTQRDLWDLAPVRSLRGDTSLVIADKRGVAQAELRRLADEADLAVHDVGSVWTGAWSREPVVIMPRTQQDMATLIGSDGKGLAQIAAVTTGSYESGLSRGDRIVINPAAWNVLGQLGRRVVLTHEMTHVATRASSVQAPPIWLSEGFADYVAYQATPVPTSIVASDVLDEVRAGKAPQRLPDDADFDASRGDIAASYEGAWLACRMIAERYGEKRLVRFYRAMSDSAGPGWPQETQQVLGISRGALVRDWKAYLRDKAAS